MKVKITNCTDPMLWYADHIGNDYEVSIETRDYYVVIASDGFNNIIYKKDAQIIN